MNHVSRITYQRPNASDKKLLRVSCYVLREQKGVSLMEVIISMAMIVVLLVLYTAAINTVAHTRKLRYENLAYHAANKQMEELRSVQFTSLPPSGTMSDTMLNQIPSGAGSFTVADHAGFTGMKEITVTVTWNDGIAKQLELKSLAGSGGINP